MLKYGCIYGRLPSLEDAMVRLKMCAMRAILMRDRTTPKQVSTVNGLAFLLPFNNSPFSVKTRSPFTNYGGEILFHAISTYNVCLDATFSKRIICHVSFRSTKNVALHLDSAEVQKSIYMYCDD